MMFIKYIGPYFLGALVKLTTCARVYHVADRISVLFIGQIEFNISESRTLPIKRSACIQVSAISKFVATSLSEN